MYTVLPHHFDLVAVSTATSFNVFTNFRTICHNINAVDKAFPSVVQLFSYRSCAFFLLNVFLHFKKNRYWEWIFQCPFCICFAGGEEDLLIAVYLYYDQVLYHIFLLNSGCYRYNHHQIGTV